MSNLDALGLALVRQDIGAMDYASLGDEDDDVGANYYDFGDEDDDVGARRPRGRRRPARRPAPQVVQKTLVVGQTGNVVGNAQGNIIIRPQFDFVAEDVTFQGSTNTSGGWFINTIQFGDRIVFNNPVAVPVAIFATNSFVRGLVKGAAIAAGLDIQVTGAVVGGGATAASNLIATFTGLKRGSSGCGPGAV